MIANPESKGIKVRTVEKNLIISGKGRLEIRDITLQEASESRHNTEEPLFDNDQEDGIYNQ